ncbi:MAG: Lrp/AsnC family transcriptional regulator [Candidatus Methanofastidiosia archaeon]|jgi:DNA-binding Lrp family transcriptional regulator
MDKRDLKILEKLYEYGPKNLPQLVRSLDIPEKTTYRRIRNMEQRKYLIATVKPNYKALRMRYIVVFSEALSHTARNMLCTPDIKGVSSCIGYMNGYCTTHAVAEKNVDDFKRYVEYLRGEDIVSKYRMYETSRFHQIPVRADAYLQKKPFDWDAWVDSVTEGKPEEEKRKKRKTKFDKLDLFMLKELELNPRQEWVEIAEKWKEVTDDELSIDSLSKKIGWRFSNRHQNLIETFFVAASKMRGERLFDLTNLFYVTLNAMNENYAYGIGQALNGLSGLPAFAYWSKVQGIPSVICKFQMYKEDCFDFFEALLRLQDSGVLTGVETYLLSRQKALSRTIPLELFEAGDWKKINFEDYKGGEKCEEVFSKSTSSGRSGQP